MRLLQTFTLSADHHQQIRQLWNREYPERLKHDTDTSFAEYLQPLDNPRHMLLINDRDEVQGWLFVFERSGQDWFSMISRSYPARYGRRHCVAAHRQNTAQPAERMGN